MLFVDRIQQLIVLALVACSGWLLGIGQQNPGVSILAVSAAIASFVLNDWLQWVRFNRWVANVVALAVTAIALRGFFHSDSPQQLLMIANLLIYLQIVLLFQVKTPRVYWQILVLSLLQIVVAAAFHIGLEGGIIFFCYLFVSGVAMVILQVHSQTHRIRTANRLTVNAIRESQKPGSSQRRPLILAMHDQIFPNRQPMTAMIRQVCAVGVVSIAFAVVTFYLVPRDEIIWTGSQVVTDPEPGFSRTMDLEENVQIYLSNELVLEAKFFDPVTRQQIELKDELYLRGMPLTDLTLRNNQTRWRTSRDFFNSSGPPLLPGVFTSNYIVQALTIQPTPDPLLHTMLPAMRLQFTPTDMEWNDRLALLYRAPGYFLNVSTKPYEYDLAIPVLKQYKLYEAFPHRSYKSTSRQRLESNAEEFARTTYIERARYPGLIRTTETQLSSLRERNDPIAVARLLENYLSASGEFSYTLDFRNFNWDPGLDHVEDFVVNKRRGHCEFFASALVLMLRSQKIPARVVVGYQGGDFEQESLTYVIRRRHAHAWVEAYIAPDKCPREWFEQGQASGAGAWLRLDPTPPIPPEAAAATTPLVAAKDFWNTYVMGLNSSKQQNSTFQSFIQNPFRRIASLFTLRFWRSQWQSFITPGLWHKSMVTYVLAIVACIAIYRSVNYWMRRNRQTKSIVLSTSRSTSFKRILGRALSIVAPRLGRWVAGGDRAVPDVPFYQRFQRLMHRQGQVRLPFQTAREFAASAESTLPQNNQSAAIRAHIESVIEKFYWVRFSQRELTDEELQQVESSLSFLEQNLTPNPSLS